MFLNVGYPKVISGCTELAVELSMVRSCRGRTFLNVGYPEQFSSKII